MKQYRLVSLVGIMLLLLLMAWTGTLAGAAAPQQENAVTGTATPLAMPTLVPSTSSVDDSHMQKLAQAVAIANETVGASTSWPGHEAVDAALTVAVGEKLPGFGLMTRADDTFRLDVAGESTLLNFWASWCGPCAEELPLLIAADSDPELPFRVAFINIWDDAYTYAEFLDDYPADIQMMRDGADTLPELYGLEFVPISILVDEWGEVVLIQHGLVHEAALQLAAALLRADD